MIKVYESDNPSVLSDEINHDVEVYEYEIVDIKYDAVAYRKYTNQDEIKYTALVMYK